MEENSLEKTELKAYAKLNLYLDVLDKRPDGFHEIITLFQSIDISDHITITMTAGKQVDFEVKKKPATPLTKELAWNDKNTLYKTLRAVEDYLGNPIRGMHIKLVKGIPDQSGLGGASSDAAQFLIFLSRRYSIPFGDQLKIASAVGSDVPFFLYGGTAIGREKGDRIETLERLVDIPVLVALPDIKFSTPKMYSVVDALRFEEWETIEDTEKVDDFEGYEYREPLNDEVLNDWDDEVDSWSPEDDIKRIYGMLSDGERALTFNDFEKAAEELDLKEYRRFSETFRNLRSDSILIRGMTGSGAAHYIAFRAGTPEEAIDRVKKTLETNSSWVKRARFI